MTPEEELWRKRFGIFALLAWHADAAITLVERACEPGRSPQ